MSDRVVPQGNEATGRRSDEGRSGPRRKLAIVGAAVLVLSVLASAVWKATADARVTRRTIERLDSKFAEDRKRAAWDLAERNAAAHSRQAGTPAPLLEGTPAPLLASSLLASRLDREPDPDVREAYVYAFGKLGDSSATEIVANAALNDPSGYVRQAAWLALARVNAARFLELATTDAAGRDAWAEIGVAQGWFAIGDARGADNLLRLAANGTEEQRLVAWRALAKNLVPLLDTAGRWPIEAELPDSRPWPVELVEEVARRCRSTDVQAILADSARHTEQAEAVLRNVRKVTRAREQLARLLFSPAAR